MKKNGKNKKLFFCLIGLIVSFSLFMTLFFQLEPDYLWHIKVGEYMFHNGLIKHDIFSWIVKGKYWVNHEWLFEVILYGLKTIFGQYHIFVYLFLSLILLLGLLFLLNYESFKKNISFSLLFLLFFFILANGFIQARPHLIHFSLLAFTVYVLYDLYSNKDSKKIYFLPIVTILWANLHGGSSNLPYLLCFLFFIGGFFSFKFSKVESIRLSNKQLCKYFFVMILCMISVCVNIHGFKMFFYPYVNILDSTMISNISEWRATSLHDVYHYTYYLFLLFVIVVMLFSSKRIRFIDLLLFILGTYLGLKSIRFWLYIYIFMSYSIFYYVRNRSLDKGTCLSIVISSLTLISIFLIYCGRVINVSYDNYLDKKVISIIKERKPKKLYNMYNYGGELIYNDILVFIDGRADLYGKYNYKDYLDISVLQKNSISLIKKYDFDYFLVDSSYPIATYLKTNKKYELIYHSEKVFLYYKKNS